MNPLVTALEEEGFTDVMSSHVVESFARHFMVAIDSWQESGFGAVAKSYLERLPREQGVRRDIDENGDLLVRRMGKAEAGEAKVSAAARSTGLVRSRSQGAAHVKLLRTIRLDASDTFVFEKAAEPGEWAVSGAFVFWNRDAASLEGKARSAFRSGFLGISTLGWSTLVQIVEASEDDRLAVIDTLARQLVAHFGAPTIDDAVAAAEEEVAFAESLCTQPQDTLVAVHRTFEDGAVRESFRTLRPRSGPKPARAFSFLEVEGEDEQPGEQVDLIAMADRERK